MESPPTTNGGHMEISEEGEGNPPPFKNRLGMYSGFDQIRPLQPFEILVGQTDALGM